MKFYKTLALIVLVGAFFAGSADAAQDQNELVGKIRKTYENLNAFKGEFKQVLSHRESGTNESRDGRLSFQKPLLIRWQTARPHEETLVVTGKEIWDYLPDEEIVYRYPASMAQDSRSIIQVITGQAALTKDFKIKNLGNENGLVKMALYPKEASPQMVEANIWVEPATGYIKRAKIIDFYGNANDVSFKTFEPAQKIDAGQFRFTPPKGVEVEDRLDRKVEERELFK
ncbi:MAG: outer membrane lipoprotein chaperone LolA [Desulfovibrio sp.]|jgi:outer membrane lipoprotein carrier protein